MHHQIYHRIQQYIIICSSFVSCKRTHKRISQRVLKRRIVSYRNVTTRTAHTHTLTNISPTHFILHCTRYVAYALLSYLAVYIRWFLSRRNCCGNLLQILHFAWYTVRSVHALLAYLAVYTYVDFYPVELLRYCVLTDRVHDMWRCVMYCCTREYSLSGRRVLKQRGCVRNNSGIFITDALRYDDWYPRVGRYGCITST